eukprot:Rhum_TRINITY_DN14968_c0_g1::Rhum_TRINITY_DN14968_c0_g1_i2::g.130363::m.130363
MTRSIGHVLVGASSMLGAMLLLIAMADGRSLFVQRDTETELHVERIMYRAGVGIVLDNNGHGWHDRQHELFGCDAKEHMGNVIMAFSFITLGMLCVSLFVNLIGASSTKGLFGMVSLVCQVAAALFLLVTLAVGTSLYDRYYCGTRVKAKFHMSYGLWYVLCLFLQTIFNAVVLVVTGALKGDEAKAVDLDVEMEAVAEAEP